MAFAIVKKEVAGAQGGEPIVTIIMDSTSDASSLPTYGCAPGSIAVVADEGTPCYMLNASGTWTALQS